MTTEMRLPELCTPEPYALEMLEAALTRYWIVIITDPDWTDDSPWPVMADEIGEAVAKAVEDWAESQIDPDDPEPDELDKPHIVKVYRASLITEIAWSHPSTKGLGTYDMSKLANPKRWAWP
jgi:hypothetical protein